MYAQGEGHGRMTMRRSYRDHCESCLYLDDHTVQQKRLSRKTEGHISNITPYDNAIFDTHVRASYSAGY